MKKSMALILCIIFSLSTIGCSSYDYDGWSTISIDGCGTLMIPAEWDMYESDGYIYIVDQQDNPMMIETHSHAGVKENDFGDVESNEIFQEFRCLRTITSEGLSNSATYGIVLVEKNGIQSQQFFIDFWQEQYGTLSFVVWSESIDEHLVKKIASSFVIAQGTAPNH